MTEIGNKQILAKNLIYYTERSGKTQREICDILDIKPTTFNDWIKAKKYPRIDKIEILANYFGIQKSDLIENKMTAEKEKDNDTLASIIVRMRTDEKFSAVVQTIYNMDPSKIDGVKQMLETLQTFGK